MFLFGNIYKNPGKKYEVLDIRERNEIIEYYISDDISRAWHYGYNFITLDEIRNGKLEELGIWDIFI